MPTPFKPGLLIENDLARYRYSSFYPGAGADQEIPEAVDYKRQMLPTSNQGNQPRCAGYAMAGIIEWWNWKFNGIKRQVDPDRIYELAKAIDGQPNQEGTTLEAVVQAAVKLELIPIDLSTLQTVRQVNARRALHKHGVLLSGFIITSGWERAKADGWIEDGGGYLGGHAVVTIGYSDVDNPKWVGVQNSWGDSQYGWRGFCRMSPEQFNNEFLYGLTWEYRS